MIRLLVLLTLISFTLSEKPVLKVIGSEVHNFGKVLRGTKVSHIFQLKNVSKKTIEIDRIESSCGCTAALISNKVLKPGQVAKITAEFNSEGFSGFVEKSVTVYLKNNPVPSNTLKIQATVEVEFEIVPFYMVFDNAIVGVEKQGIVQIINRTNKKVKILGIENSNPNIKISYDKDELKPGEFLTLQGTFLSNTSGLIRGSFYVLTDASQKKIEIKFYSNVKDKL